MIEEFKVIKEFPDYEINLEGVVRRIKDGFIPKIRLNCRGWFAVSLNKGNGYRSVYVDKLINGAFNSPEEEELTSLKDLGYPNYSITYDGKVWSHQANKYLSQKMIGHGYPCVSVANSKGATSFLIHRILALLFIPNPENKPTVNHIDGNKENNCITNLEWNTHKENNTHAIYNDMRDAILSTEVVHEICTLLQNNIGCTVKSICDKLGVSWDQVGDIRKRETWTKISEKYVW